MRTVVCAKFEENSLITVGDEECDPSTVMSDQQNCTGTDCIGLWFTGPWGKVGARHWSLVEFYQDPPITRPSCDIFSKSQ